MLGMHMVQHAVTALHQVIGALLMPTENCLLLERLSPNWTGEDPLGVGHMPRVWWALEQSRCSISLGISSCPDVRATRSSFMQDADSMQGVPSGSNMQNSM
jgi:hypothetical protein